MIASGSQGEKLDVDYRAFDMHSECGTFNWENALGLVRIMLAAAVVATSCSNASCYTAAITIRLHDGCDVQVQVLGDELIDRVAAGDRVVMHLTKFCHSMKMCFRLCELTAWIASTAQTLPSSFSHKLCCVGS